MTILIVDDSPDLIRACARPLRRICTVRTAGTFQDAIASFDAHNDWRAVVIDVNLGKGFERGGLELLAHVRKRSPRLAVAMLSGDDSRGTVNHAAQLGAVYIVKPIDMGVLRMFVERALIPTPIPAGVAPAGVGVVLRIAAERFQLSPREQEVLGSAVARVPRERFLEEHAISRSTWDKHVGRILQKSGADTLEQLVADLLDEAVTKR